MADWDIHTASEEFLFDLCERVYQEHGMIGGELDGVKVLKLSDEVAVKVGATVTAAEARTQQFAHENLDPNIVRVPQVYRFIEDKRYAPAWPTGLLFMQYVAGPTLKELDLEGHKDIIPRMIDIIISIGQVQASGPAPGPVGGGAPRGNLWGDYGAKTEFKDADEMNVYVNKRLALRDLSVDLTSYPLVLCHNDLSRRNLILREKDNSIWLVDWGHSGFYPRCFEVASLSCVNPWEDFYEATIVPTVSAAIELTEGEEHLMKMMQLVRAANLRWPLRFD